MKENHNILGMPLPTILAVGALSALLLLGGCGSPSQVAEKPKVKPKPVQPKPIQLTLEQKLFQAVRFEADDTQIKQLVEQGANINAQDEWGYSVFHYILASRDKAMVAWALEKGAKPNIKNSQNGLTPKQMMLSIHQPSHYPAIVKPLTNGFSLATINPEINTKKSVSKLLADEEIAKLQLLQTYLWRQQEITKQLAIWRQEKKQKQRSHQWKIALLEWKLIKLKTPISQVPQPSEALPLNQSKKSSFETMAMFREKLRGETEFLRKENNAILEQRSEQVEQHNNKIRQRNRQLQELEREISTTIKVMSPSLTEFQEQQKVFYQQLNKTQIKQQKKFYAQALAEAYGTPLLRLVEINGQIKYEPEISRMYAELRFSRVGIQEEVIMEVPPGLIAENFYKQLKANKLLIKIEYQKDQATDQFTIQKIHTKHQDEPYEIKLKSRGSQLVPPKITTTIIQSQETTVSLQLNGDKLKNLANLAKIHFPYQEFKAKDSLLKNDRKQAFNDDIPQLLKEAPLAPINPTRWLFVVGAGKYKYTDSIPYTRRSAEFFTNVTKKTLGIEKEQQVMLLDQRATSQTIAQQLNSMLSKVRQGDSIYFYYSGHIVPIAEQSNEPYLLPTDKSIDTIGKDNFYRMKNIYKELEDSKASQVFVFIDSCFKSPSLDESKKLAVFIACSDKQSPSNVYHKKGHRLFSYHVMRALLENVSTTTRNLKKQIARSIEKSNSGNQTPTLEGNQNLIINK